jgi:hypothetical protein
MKRYEELRAKAVKVLDNKLSSELKPFLNGIKKLKKSSKEYQIFREAYTDFKAQVQDKREVFSSMLPTDFDSSDLKDNLYSLFLYLGMVESVGRKIIDLLVLLLVANGKDLGKKIEVASMDDLDNEKKYISLGTKLTFLKDNGLLEVVSIIDREFRNAIAHLKFQIRNNSAYFKGKNAFATAFNNLEKLTMAVDIIDNLLIKLDDEIDLTS